MGIFKSELETLDEMTKYGFELAVRYAKMARKHDKDPIEMMEEVLSEWEQPK